MISRRTRARLSFLGALISLLQQIYQWPSPGEDDESRSWLPHWVVVGIAYQLAYSWAYDRDLSAIRTSRLRRVLFEGGVFPLTLRAFSRWPGRGYNVSIGSGIARIGYRFWYGVLQPLPETDE